MPWQWKAQCKCGSGTAGVSDTKPPDAMICGAVKPGKKRPCGKAMTVEISERPEPRVRHWTEFRV